MNLVKISGNTFYIPGPTNVGVFVFKDKYTLVIDTGDSNSTGRAICGAIQSAGLNIKHVMNTHEHPDHWGGHLYIQEHYPGSRLYSSASAALLMENDFLFPMYLYGGNPLPALQKGLIRQKKVAVAEQLEAGIWRLNDEKFEVIPLPGHARGQIGISTRDKVCFLGDAIFSNEILDKYSFPFLLDIGAQYHTLQVLPDLPYEYYVLGHAIQVYTREEIGPLVSANLSKLNQSVDLALSLLDQPKTREELLEEIVILEDLSVDLHEYFYLLSTLAGIITHLVLKEAVEYQLENGKLFYYRK